MTEHINSRRAYYFSAEFLVGQPVYKNLMCLDIESQIEEALSGFERSLKEFEALPDEPLGNGGLGRLAACFWTAPQILMWRLTATVLSIVSAFLSRKLKTVFKLKRYIILLNIMTLGVYLAKVIRLRSVLAIYDVWAVPYDMPIISFKTRKFSTLRLWQCESINEFDFALFSEQKYTKSLEEKIMQRIFQDSYIQTIQH